MLALAQVVAAKQPPVTRQFPKLSCVLDLYVNPTASESVAPQALTYNLPPINIELKKAMADTTNNVLCHENEYIAIKLRQTTISDITSLASCGIV